MIHRNAFAAIWIKRGMREPGKNGSRPATKPEIGKLTSVDIFKSHQNRTHFLLGVPLDHTERPLCIQTTAKLPPEGVRSRKNFLERNDGAVVSSHQAQADLPLVGWGSQVVRQFFEKCQMC